MTSFHIDPLQDDDKSWLSRHVDCMTTFLEENRQNIFYLFVFYVITIALFIERFIRKYSHDTLFIYNNFKIIYVN